MDKPTHLSKLIFEGFWLEEVMFKGNDSFSFAQPVRLDYDIRKGIVDQDIDQSRAIVAIEYDAFTGQPLEQVPFHLRLRAIGSFRIETEEDISPELRCALLNQNAPAILFPFVRASIASITAAANYPPVIVPVLNINHVKGLDSESTEE
jgi:preprotein translocase subunit SecB